MIHFLVVFNFSLWDHSFYIFGTSLLFPIHSLHFSTFGMYNWWSWEKFLKRLKQIHQLCKGNDPKAKILKTVKLRKMGMSRKFSWKQFLSFFADLKTENTWRSSPWESRDSDPWEGAKWSKLGLQILEEILTCLHWLCLAGWPLEQVVGKFQIYSSGRPLKFWPTSNDWWQMKPEQFESPVPWLFWWYGVNSL